MPVSRPMQGTSWGKDQNHLMHHGGPPGPCKVRATHRSPCRQAVSYPAAPTQGTTAGWRHHDRHGQAPIRLRAPVDGEGGKSSGDTRDRPPVPDEWQAGANDTNPSPPPWGERNGDNCGSWGDCPSRFKQLVAVTLIRVTAYIKPREPNQRFSSVFRISYCLVAGVLPSLSLPLVPSRPRQGP
jgi:hypothetical protein